ncbi:conserved hypothetical protein, partial [Trichinella spiralis]
MDNLNQRRAAQVRWLKVAMDNMEAALDGSALHAFGDASETAYGAVVYLVVTEEDHSTISNLVMAKSPVAPLKKMTLPRLELMAAQMAAKLITFVRDAMKIRIDRLTCCTHGKITLCWIK